MSKILTVCIDANVYISAIAFGGKPSKIVELALARKFDLVVSMPILNEVKRNLIQKLDFTEEEVNSFLNILVLETALMANADILVTGDKKDLLPLKTFKGLIIEAPAAFLDRLEKLNTL